MSTLTETGVEALPARFGATLARRLRAHIERLQWDAGQLREFQRDELRRLLAAAVERSPFHARRLGGVDPERFETRATARAAGDEQGADDVEL
jgi:hypothetical protein